MTITKCSYNNSHQSNIFRNNKAIFFKLKIVTQFGMKLSVIDLTCYILCNRSYMHILHMKFNTIFKIELHYITLIKIVSIYEL